MIVATSSWVIVAAILLGATQALAGDSVSPLNGAKPPATVDELWARYDPQVEPLHVEVIKQWEQDGIVCRVVRYDIGTFKGKPARMVAIYGFPKGGSNLPALLQVHGGGQSANLNVVLANARRGYACVSINWAANPLGGVSGYDGPNTDWGAVDATQNGHPTHFQVFTPDEKTIDAVDSPRNNSWYLLILAARRSLTFLEQQPEVNPSKLGIYGHSMGGNVSFETAAVDSRVKAAVPSCGAGIADGSDNLYAAAFNRSAYAVKVTQPIMFMDPANDFHGTIEGIQRTADLVERQDKNIRYVRAPQLNHRDEPDHLASGLLWFDQYLKGEVTVPATPITVLQLKTHAGIPHITVKPDHAESASEVDVYFTQQGDSPDVPNRFWHHAPATKSGAEWTADLPLLVIDRPLWVYADVTYPLDQPLTSAGYYYSWSTARHFTISSKLLVANANDLKLASAKSTDAPSTLIESFDAGWQKQWYSYESDGGWPYRTHKLNDPKWAAPAWSKLALEARSDQANPLVIELDGRAAKVDLAGGDQWQSIVLYATDFRNIDGGSCSPSWTPIGEMTIGSSATLEKKDKRVTIGGSWQGSAPALRNLHWEKGTAAEANARREVKLKRAPGSDCAYLDIASAESLTSFGEAMDNQVWGGGPLAIGSRKCDHGLGVHAPSDAVYFLDGQFSRFTADVGLSDGGTVRFCVYCDDQKAFDSGVMRGGDAPRRIDLPLQGARQLRLVVTDGGDGNSQDHAVWANPRVQ